MDGLGDAGGNHGRDRGAWLGRLTWGAFLLVLAILVAKFFVADVYRVTSGSMRPTIFGGAADPRGEAFTEWVLVRYERGLTPQRFGLVVLDGEAVPIVKRVVGLPGESIRILDGDVLIDGARLPADAARPTPIVVFDEAYLPVEDYFSLKGGEGEGPWERIEREWRLDASDVPLGSFAGMMYYQPELRDDYLDQAGRRVVGRRTVNDAILELEFRLETSTGALRFQLQEKADTFELRLEARPDDGGGAMRYGLELSRRNLSTERRGPGARVDVLVEDEVALDAGEWIRLRFANVDDHLSVQLGEHAWRHTYDGNELFPDKAAEADQNIGPRVGFGGEGTTARFRGIRILRDLHYTSSPEEGGHGIRTAEPLGPGEFFVLGDNSVESLDSRTFGPVSKTRFVGRPVAVVWPLTRARRLPEPSEREGESPVPR